MINLDLMTELYNRGNGNIEQRKKLLARFVIKHSANKIDCLLADRELIGNRSTRLGSAL